MTKKQHMPHHAPHDAPHALPWEEMMRFAFGVLHWTPQTFWGSSLREFGAAINAHHTTQSPSIDPMTLENLMGSFPDE